MATDVVMPQMGESIAEGTVVRWIKQVGDTVEKDEPILEISTDKVDAEIPSPAAGTLLEIGAQEGETVEVGKVIGKIGDDGEAGGDSGGGDEDEEKGEKKAATSGAGDEDEAASDGGDEEKESKKKAASDTDEGDAKEAKASDGDDQAAGDDGEGVDVEMPQMGESIAEGTVTRWLKKVGDEVEKDEPIVEISTDKVDAEVPSPAAGKLTETLAEEGETVEVGKVIARIGGSGGGEAKKGGDEKKKAGAEKKADQKDRGGESSEAKGEAAKRQERAGRTTSGTVKASSGDGSREDRIRTLSSPVVRRIAAEHDIDISRVEGTGIHGRVTKKDILAFIESGGAAAPAPAPSAGGTVTQFPARASAPPVAPATPPSPSFASGERVHEEPLSVMRQRIAEHMVMSRRTSAHVQTVFEVDMSRIHAVREASKKAFQESNGVKLTYTPFFALAAIHALKKIPVVNASLEDNTILYKRDINLGIAVALDWGLIVPVVKHADGMNIVGLARAITDLATRARDKKLNPDEVQGGTFTITNPGPYGALFGLPIINQPQVGIMGVGNIQKRPVVIDDAIGIRPMVYLSLSFDHRLVDGAVADQFMAQVKWFLENNDWEKDVG